ncbi:MAG: hypothetical protein ACON42_03495 [Flavobacteriaceae bacterium]
MLNEKRNIFRIVFLLLLFANQATAQIKGIRIFNEDTKQEIIIEENKRIRVKTIDGQRISGRFQLIDNESFLLKGNIIKLTEIEKIKKNPIMVSLLVDGLLVYVGSAMVFIPILLYPFNGDSGALYYIIPGTALLYAGKKSPNFLVGYTKSKGWNYQIISKRDATSR